LTTLAGTREIGLPGPASSRTGPGRPSEGVPVLPEAEIGANIRKIRRDRRVTLVDLARKTGFSKGYLSRIEHSEKAPPVSTLINIGQALGVSVSMLLGETGPGGGLSLVRKNERRLMARAGTTFGYAYEALAYNYPVKHMEPYILSAIPPKKEGNPHFQHQGEEMLIVTQGTMGFEYGDEEYVLETGDCIYFDSGITHRGYSLGDEDAQCLIVIYTP
jgi:transcriptional regulator with XRE-family HTH domain